MNVRLRRLESDWQALQRALAGHPRIKIESKAGNPPQRYCLIYNVKGLVEQADGTIVTKDEHLVEISLLRNYPRQAPVCRMLTPVFHPNVAPHVICIGDDWSAGESLLNLVYRIGEMIAFQSYNIKSPLNGSAARWVEENVSTLPVDSASMQPPDRVKPEADAKPEIAAKPQALKPFVFRCGGCGTKLSAQPEHAGLKIECPQCKAVCRVPSAE